MEEDKTKNPTPEQNPEEKQVAEEPEIKEGNTDDNDKGGGGKNEDKKINPPKKGGGGWFAKIPQDVLLSPGGAVLITFAVLMEGIDLIPIPFFDQLWEFPLEIIFILLLVKIAKVPLKSSVIPFIAERIPGINDIVPTWIIRMLR